MIRKTSFALLWLGFSIYAFTIAPPSQPDTFDLIIKLSSGQWDNINPLIVTLFNLMGIWPMIYAGMALADGVGQKLPAWPFVTLSFGIGAFALLPYLALRDSNQTFNAKKSLLLKVVDSPWTGRFLMLGALALLGYGTLNGDLAANWNDFIGQWRISRFINVMSLDFCMLCAIVSPLLKDDMAKRGLWQTSLGPVLFWIGALVPLLGVLFYLSVRPPLREFGKEPDTALSEASAQ